MGPSGSHVEVPGFCRSVKLCSTFSRLGRAVRLLTSAVRLQKGWGDKCWCLLLVLGQWPEALNWALGVLGSLLMLTCSVHLGLFFSLSGAHLPWLAGLCLFLGFLSPLTVCDFHRKYSSSKNAFIRLNIMTLEGMQFIYIFPRLFLAAWGRACDWRVADRCYCVLEDASVAQVPEYLRCLQVRLGQGLALRLGAGGVTAVPRASSQLDPEPASVPWGFSGMHRCLPVWLPHPTHQHVACRILVPWPGIEPRPTAVKALSANHWTTRKLPSLAFYGMDWVQRWFKPIPSPEIPQVDGEVGWASLLFSPPGSPGLHVDIKGWPPPFALPSPSSNGRL